MNIRRVIWLPDVEEKIWRKHHVTADEAEEVFGNAPWVHFRGGRSAWGRRHVCRVRAERWRTLPDCFLHLETQP